MSAVNRTVKAALTARAVIASPIPGVPAIEIIAESHELAQLHFQLAARAPVISAEPALMEAASLLQNYFLCAEIRLPYFQPQQGTAFQHRVWELLQQIPVGEKRTYGEIARQLKSSARAVAGACRANPLPILIPCHRVVAASGPGGYMGQTKGKAMVIKLWLLQHEAHV